MQRAEAAHGKARDIRIFRPFRQAERLPDIVHQLNAHHRLERMAGGEPVQVEGVLRVRHHNREIVFHRQGLRHPVACFSRIPVQQEQGLHRPGRCRHSLPRVIGNQHLKRGCPVQCLGIVFNPKICHLSLPFPVYDFQSGGFSGFYCTMNRPLCKHGFLFTQA